MSFTFDDERDYDRRQEAIADARERRRSGVVHRQFHEQVVEERDDEITKLRGLLRALVDEIDYTGRRFCQRCPESNCDQTEPLQECAYHAAKAALRGEG